jgi:hypothetical protein
MGEARFWYQAFSDNLATSFVSQFCASEGLVWFEATTVPRYSLMSGFSEIVLVFGLTPSGNAAGIVVLAFGCVTVPYEAWYCR